MVDCQDPRCTRVDGRCVGLHCVHCGEPSSSQGHPECARILRMRPTEQSAKVLRFPCPTCSGPVRETVGMVCQTCGTDYGDPVEQDEIEPEVSRD